MIKAKKKQKISPDIPISDLAEMHPELIDILIYVYGLHCIGCIIAEFETLREGAMAHGIIGKEFNKMMKDLNKKVYS